jgi:hypothetical protein
MPRYRVRNVQTSDVNTTSASMTETRRRILMLWGALVIFCTVLLIGGGIAGSYLLNLNNTQRALHVAAENNLHSSQGTCRALLTLDKARDGIVFPNIDQAHPSERALTNLFAGIHGVVEASHCSELLAGDYHFVDGQVVIGRS